MSIYFIFIDPRAFVRLEPGRKEERNEKQRENDAKAPQESKQRDKRMFGAVMGHLMKAKKVLDSQETKLQKQLDITKRVDEKDKKEMQDLKECQDKRKESLFQERKELEKELAQDEYKRQVKYIHQIILSVIKPDAIVCYYARIFYNQVKLKVFIYQQTFRAEPHILWKPAKMNEGLNTLKKESLQTFKEMELMMKEKLQNAFKQFSDRDLARIQQKEQLQIQNPEHHESSQSESEESESGGKITNNLGDTNIVAPSDLAQEVEKVVQQ